MQVINWETTVATGMFTKLVLFFVVMNALCVCAAWPFAKHLHVIFRLNQKVLYSITFITLVALVYYMGSIVTQQFYYLMVLGFLMPLGYMLRRWDTLIIIFAFVLQSQIQGALLRLFHLYSDFLPHIPVVQ